MNVFHLSSINLSKRFTCKNKYDKILTICKSVLEGKLMKVSVCIGSSCHIKGSRQVVEQLQSLIKENSLEEKVELAGSFCNSKCNRTGVTIAIEDNIYTGITPETVKDFFKENILSVLN